MKRRSIFIGIATAGVGAALLISTGMYPVMLVGLRLVSERRVNAEYRAAAHYAIVAIKTYGGDIEKLALEGGVDIRRATLDHTVNTLLVRKELKRRLKGRYDDVLRSKLAEARGNTEFQRSATTLYNVDFDLYDKMFLTPQAEAEILDENLRVTDSSTIEEWLADVRATANIRILYPSIVWKDGEIAM